MTIRRLSVAAGTVALSVAIGSANALAFTSSIAVSRDKTTVLEQPGAAEPTSYSAAIRRQVLIEIKRTHVPFAIASPIPFVMYFKLDRRGQLIDVKTLQGANLAEANEYAETIIRKAARRFPAPPANIPQERLQFVLPILMTAM